MIAGQAGSAPRRTEVFHASIPCHSIDVTFVISKSLMRYLICCDNVDLSKV